MLLSFFFKQRGYMLVKYLRRHPGVIIVPMLLILIVLCYTPSAGETRTGMDSSNPINQQQVLRIHLK